MYILQNDINISRIVMYYKAIMEIVEQIDPVIKYDEINRDTEIYKTIENWDTCSANVLANKIKKVNVYYNEFVGKKRTCDSMYGEGWDRNNIYYQFILRWKNFKAINSKILRAKKTIDTEDKSIYYFTTINLKWLNSYHLWIASYLEKMRNRLEVCKQETLQKKKELSNTLNTECVDCPCGGTYLLTNLSHHKKTTKHKNYLLTL